MADPDRIGSGSRTLILSDKVSDGTEQVSPIAGRILIFLDASNLLWSKDSSGVVRPLNGGTLSDFSWESLSLVPPPPNSPITHDGQVAIGLSSIGTIPATVNLLVVGNEALGGSLYVEEASAGADLATHNQIFASSTDKGLFTKPDGLPERRIDAPGLIRKTLPASEAVIAPDGSQYLVFGSFTLGAGASLTLLGDADLVIL
jgi:hypothetical protein